MDLHAWITQQVDEVEAAVRAGLEGRRVAFQPNDGGPTITGAVTGVTQTPDGPQFTLSQYDVEPIGTEIVPIQPAVAALRRCEADRRILARHRIDPDCLAWAACKGCGNDDWGLPNVDSINDCPELLDLAHAHGLTDEILTGLDRPRPSESKPVFGGSLTHGTVITTSNVPAALRGRRWKP